MTGGMDRRLSCVTAGTILLCCFHLSQSRPLHSPDAPWRGRLASPERSLLEEVADDAALPSRTSSLSALGRNHHVDLPYGGGVGKPRRKGTLVEEALAVTGRKATKRSRIESPLVAGIPPEVVSMVLDGWREHVARGEAAQHDDTDLPLNWRGRDNLSIGLDVNALKLIISDLHRRDYYGKVQSAQATLGRIGRRRK